MTAESFIEAFDSEGLTVGQLLDAYVEMAELPSGAEPVWERLFVDLQPTGDELGYLALHRDIVWVDDDGGEEGPVGMGWTIRMDIGGRAEQIEGRTGVGSPDAPDAPELDLAELVSRTRRLLGQRGLLDARPERVTQFT